MSNDIPLAQKYRDEIIKIDHEFHFEYTQLCESIIEECNRLQNIFKEKKHNFELLKENSDLYSVRREFSNGGENIHRGFYCPSPILDIVIGNANRGKLINRLTKRSRPRYEYHFDEYDRLFFIIKYEGNDIISNECIFYQDNKTIGIEIENTCETVSECVYADDKIVQYINGFRHQNRIDECRKEIYTYDENGLLFVDCYSIFAEKYLSRCKYIFEHDEEGYLKKYIVPGYDSRIQEIEYAYDVHIKRKV